MTHEDLWRALDTLAAEKGLSPSGLARLAGLDPTSFNRSKRFGPNGARWPNTESLARVLSATGVALDAFATLVSGGRVLSGARTAPALPVRLLSLLGGTAPALDAPATERLVVPVPAAPGCYLVRINTARFEPALRENDLVLLHPDATIGPGDRILCFTGAEALFCIADIPFPRRLDDGAALRTPSDRHRVDWIGC